MNTFGFWLSASDVINKAMEKWLFLAKKGEKKSLQERDGEYKIYGDKRCYIEYLDGSSIYISKHKTHTIARFQSLQDGGYEICTVWCPEGHLVVNVESDRNRYIYENEECPACEGKINQAPVRFRGESIKNRHI